MEDQEFNGHIFVDVQKTIVIGGATVFILGEARLEKIKGSDNSFASAHLPILGLLKNRETQASYTLKTGPQIKRKG